MAQNETSNANGVDLPPGFIVFFLPFTGRETVHNMNINFFQLKIIRMASRIYSYAFCRGIENF